MAIEQAMAPYVSAQSLEEAEAALDGLVPGDPVPGEVLGECYDDLAEAAADDGDLAAAARLERKALDAGFDNTIARSMLAWYLLCAGDREGGETLFAQLREEQPDDVELVIALGNARSQAGLEDEALAAFDEALAVARRTGRSRDLDRARVERREEREEAGLEPDEDDRLAPKPVDIGSEQVVWSLAWFPPDQHAAALARWPDLEEDLADRDYARRLEKKLREMRAVSGRAPSVAPLDVEGLVAWAEDQGLDPGSGQARSGFAAEMSRTGRAIAWPPARNEPCWCRSGRKYKRCCGS